MTRGYDETMTKARTVSMELRAIREQLNESPPPPPSGTTIREWFAGLALMNQVLMRDIEPAQRVNEAIRLADELMSALAAPRVPAPGSLDVPVDADDLVRSWNGMADTVTTSRKKDEQDRVTRPELKRQQTMVPGVRPKTPGEYSSLRPNMEE